MALTTRLRALHGSTDGAVAPTVALCLVALIGVGGIAFDYARMAGLHSELQNAADQAALAAATQLDGKSGAIARATAAASALVTNSTLLAYDAGTKPSVAMAKVEFYTDQGTTATTADATARFVKVTVDGREVHYALTPIVGAISSGSLDAIAMAGLGSAICKVPPLMICNPAEATDPAFTVGNYLRKGLKLVSGGWAPGNFGFLKTGSGNGTPDLAKAIGWVSLPYDCSPGTGVSTNPGNMGQTVIDALNTRFDVGDSSSCPSGGTCPPSTNSTKDLVKDNKTTGNQACIVQNKGWQEAATGYGYYLGGKNGKTATPVTTTTALPTTGAQDPLAMGYPRDLCHAFDTTCSGQTGGSRIGDGVWDIDAYFRVNYKGLNHSGWMAGTHLAANASRYEVYKWEMDNAGTVLNGQKVLDPAGRPVDTLYAYGAPKCVTPGMAPGGSHPDRRRLSVAVVNCTANSVNGNSTNLPVQKWIDVFLTEPSLGRSVTYKSGTSKDEMYVEVIAEAGTSTSAGTAGQVVRRDVPYLVK
ncbi:TadE/TadG family type IV pilus assembly protein [Sphingobium nicotianae]|uniref:Pilus assembly protein n=1 Tax=Sphingobium nicotianae TaxID=2782607 RepID=A0A9X1DCV3_9SPHN|nr:pilus assembly protein TadG-related protein [Sphingobium nicotianae]MBT2187263.1 pilus assembly protein [Sphingobium nicotianae]